jgi:hypothetical protein
MAAFKALRYMAYLVVFGVMLVLSVLLAVTAWQADRLRHRTWPGSGEPYLWKAHNSRIGASEDYRFWQLVGPLEEPDQPTAE